MYTEDDDQSAGITVIEDPYQEMNQEHQMVKKVSVNNRLNQFGTLNYTDDVTQDDDATQDQMLTFGNNESVTQGEIVEEETKLGMMIFDEHEASE